MGRIGGMADLIDAKIAGYQFGIAYLKANGKTEFSKSMIELSEEMIKDLTELKEIANGYDEAFEILLNKEDE